jgi:alkanesulfonate monooxygenase SsuD/methylene tetrahydromethanopterin reductase-like flavin-dependent oxidoreductase (luciferase family)
MGLKLGAQVLTYGATWPEVLATAQLMDRLGYDYLWGHDHLYSTGGDPYQRFYEGWTTLAGWAASTQRIKVGLTVGANTFRNPGVVAKMAVTIDHISDGRSVLGLGAGNVAFENEAHGIDPGRTLGERLDWFEEALQVILDILAGKEVTHHSAKYDFEKVRHAPLPLQEHVPVLIGAEGEKRGLRIAARHADIWQSFFGTGEDGVALYRHKDGVLKAHCADLGRDDSTIERMIGCKLIIRRDADAARRTAEELIAIHKWPDPIWDVVWAGTPQQVADWLTPFVEAGVDAFAPQIGWPYSHETIELLMGEVKPIVDARTSG